MRHRVFEFSGPEQFAGCRGIDAFYGACAPFDGIAAPEFPDAGDVEWESRVSVHPSSGYLKLPVHHVPLEISANLGPPVTPR